MLTFYDVSWGKSLFRFINTYWRGGEKSNNRPIHRLCSLMRKMDVRTVVIEEIRPNDDDLIKIEKDALDRYFGQTLESKIFRLSFCNKTISDIDDLKSLNSNDSFIANALIMNIKKTDNEWHSYVFNSIVSIPKMKPQNKDTHLFVPILNNYIHSARDFDCYIKCSENNVYSYRIHGTYFCQQNTITSECAHAALCMTLNNINSPNAKIITAEDINRILEIDHVTTKLDTRALNVQDVEEVLYTKGLMCRRRDFFKEPNEDYANFLYYFIESRCPCLLIFSTTDNLHALSIIGHTLNTDMWRPEAEFHYLTKEFGGRKYRSASEWVDHFIIHDDNFGMYSCLPVDSLRPKKQPQFEISFRSAHAIAIIPQKVNVPPWELEWQSIKILEQILKRFFTDKYSMGFWLGELWQSIQPIFSKSPEKENLLNQIVTRTLLIQKEDYPGNLNFKDFNNVSFSDHEKLEIMEDLPDIFWLTEISLPDLYTANKTKLVDVFHPTDVRFDKDNEAWIQIRIPGYLLRKSKEEVDDFVKPCGILSHYPLFRFNPDQKVCEW